MVYVKHGGTTKMITFYKKCLVLKYEGRQDIEALTKKAELKKLALKNFKT